VRQSWQYGNFQRFGKFRPRFTHLGSAVAALCLLISATAQFPSHDSSQMQRDIEHRQLKELNKRRQQEIRDDTAKLFQLATELKAAVDKSNENVLSLDVVRKAGEVEKLAKQVKEKMKESVGPPLRVEPLPKTPYPGPPR
jgi:ABC-type transporter Mla subunit MlaD